MKQFGEVGGFCLVAQSVQTNMEVANATTTTTNKQTTTNILCVDRDGDVGGGGGVVQVNG